MKTSEGPSEARPGRFGGHPLGKLDLLTIAECAPNETLISVLALFYVT
jgi:hypothetical protein